MIFVIMLLVSLILKWMNYVWIQLPVEYWQLLILAVGVTLTINMSKLLKMAWFIAFCATFLAQFINWAQLLEFPIFHR